VLGEYLNSIYFLNGKITSVTTDGFVTDIDEIENKTVNLLKENSVLSLIRKQRLMLTVKHDEVGNIQLEGCPDSLEVKTKVQGITQ
jgi:hypothetical protein